jgi:hypothetical protein
VRRVFGCKTTEILIRKPVRLERSREEDRLENKKQQRRGGREIQQQKRRKREEKNRNAERHKGEEEEGSLPGFIRHCNATSIIPLCRRWYRHRQTINGEEQNKRGGGALIAEGSGKK